MKTNLRKILSENNITQQALLKAIEKEYEGLETIKTDRLSILCRGEFPDVRFSSLIQIVDGLKVLGVDCTPNDLIINEDSKDGKW